ncbi:hypothetical protein [Actinophytocola sp.]|uniref:hypothetical protein n=1 Tax=Actinophytocola sp. TaxID=1872138 RepID=UPI003D6B7186
MLVVWRTHHAPRPVLASWSGASAGWFGGEGNGEVRPASSSFLNEVTWQLQRLAERGR